MGRVSGKVAVVTGAARGQGRSHAQILAAEGADIIAIDLCADIDSNSYPLATPDDLAETARLVEKEDRRVTAIVADVRDRAALDAAIAQGVEQLGRLDIVVANAGIAPFGTSNDPQAFADAVDVDLVGVINLVHSSLRHLQSGASIMATGSLAAFMATITAGGINAGSGGVGYGFAKQVVAHYVNDLSVILGPKNIRVNGIHPTNCDTDMLQNPAMYRAFRRDLDNPTREDAEQAFPVLHTMPVPYVESRDVSEVVLFLASDASRYITGQQFRVDAGAWVKAKPWAGP